MSWEQGKLEKVEEKGKVKYRLVSSSSERPILLFVVHSKKPLNKRCEIFERFYFSSEQVAKIAKKFQLIRLDLAKVNRKDYKGVLRQWKIRHLPELLAFSPDGKKLGSFWKGNLKKWLEVMLEKHSQQKRKKKMS